MTSVVGRRALQAVKKLPFCYVCGHQIQHGAKSDDHVPPKSCIALVDRADSPLILPTHIECNLGYSYDDERLGQFLSLLHGRRPSIAQSLMKFTTVGGDHMALSNVNLYGAIERWIRAIYAALYSRPISATTRFAIELPCAAIVQTPSGVAMDSGRPRQRTLCEETIRRNRDARCIDRLAAWNGKLRFECVWELTPLHAYCVFWLDFYEWRRLAAISNTPARECVGFFEQSRDDLPPQATVATAISTLDSGMRFGL